jgi:ABC-type branched-subunit amino acid transport system ATPase component
MGGRLQDRVHSLSYGEQKLVSALVTAATGAGILLLDEPMAGVHGEGVAHIIGFARQIASSGRLIIFVEHDMAAVRQLAETVVVMDQGRIFAMGPPAEILERRDLLEAYFV